MIVNEMVLKELSLFRYLFSVSVLCLSVPVALAQRVENLLQEADSLFISGRTTEALSLHQKTLLLDPECFESNAWLGNYYFLKGNETLRDIEKTFQALVEPTRMQQANHKEQLKRVYDEYYSKADGYLQKALLVRKNEHLQKLSVSVEDYRVSIGLSSPSEKRRSKK